MARPAISLEAVTRAERIGTIDAINTAIGAADGWVQDCQFFSNISVAVRCALPARNFAEFKSALYGIGLKFDVDARQMAVVDGATPTNELTVWINVTFVHTDPDLRRTIPSVPG